MVVKPHVAFWPIALAGRRPLLCSLFGRACTRLLVEQIPQTRDLVGGIHYQSTDVIVGADASGARVRAPKPDRLTHSAASSRANLPSKIAFEYSAELLLVSRPNCGKSVMP